MKNQVIESILKNKIIVIVRGVCRSEIINLAEAMYNGGIRLLEVTFDASGKQADSETSEIISSLNSHFEGKLLVGAGTVLSSSQVEKAYEGGAKYIISPDTDGKVIERTKELGMVSIPGALTPSEIKAAHNFGADAVKLFPVCELGIPYLNAIKAPLSHIRMIAVGGVSKDNMQDLFKAGICGAGIGSSIVDKKMLENEDYDGITRLAKEFVDLL